MESLAGRIAALWLPDEVVLYIGQTSSRLSTRVAEYYRTSLGARGPHSGGWPLKLLTNLENLYVYWASTDSFLPAESTMIHHFVSHVSQTSRQLLWDTAHPLPFANLVGAGHRRLHGITGARAPR
ncbi:MAG TPA: hypothetical protein VHT30_03050 [Acidimicrobiales bacterium]|nr:hypothetical protein [Acidimicrobiales bacterium]